MLQTIAITVTGKVQGVWYRQSAKEEAERLGITGQVLNQKDGTVFIIATGTTKQLEQYTGWCRQGPPRAEVSNLAVKELPVRLFEQFSIERFAG